MDAALFGRELVVAVVGGGGSWKLNNATDDETRGAAGLLFRSELACCATDPCKRGTTVEKVLLVVESPFAAPGSSLRGICLVISPV